MKEYKKFFFRWLQLGLFLVTFMLCLGCQTKMPAKIDQGGFLRPADYTKLQQVASQLPPRPSKTWSPLWVYYVESGQSFKQFQSITIPDLEMPVPEKNELLKDIPDAIRGKLLDKKLFREVIRAKPHGGLALVGSLTRERKGSVAAAIVTPQSNIIQVEFKLLVDDKPVGAIQAYAFNTLPGSGILSPGGGVFMALTTALYRGFEGGLDDKVADILVESFTSLNSGMSSKVEENGRTIVPSMFEGGAI